MMLVNLKLLLKRISSILQHAYFFIQFNSYTMRLITTHCQKKKKLITTHVLFNQFNHTLLVYFLITTCIFFNTCIYLK